MEAPSEEEEPLAVRMAQAAVPVIGGLLGGHIGAQIGNVAAVGVPSAIRGAARVGARISSMFRGSAGEEPVPTGAAAATPSPVGDELFGIDEEEVSVTPLAPKPSSVYGARSKSASTPRPSRADDGRSPSPFRHMILILQL